MVIKKRNEKLKIFFYHTQDSGVGMWRMVHPMKWINKLGLAEVRMLPFYWRTHGQPNWEKYLLECQKKGTQPSQDEFMKKSNTYPKPIQISQIEELVNWSDIVVAMRKDTREYCATLLAIKDMGKPLILETDDFVHYVPSYNPGAKFYRPAGEQEIWATKQFQITENVQVTTPGLKKLYEQFNPNIKILPNLIDPDYWINDYPEPKEHPGEIRLGWTGANAHWGDLRVLKEVIHKVLDKYPQVKFHFIGQVPDWWYDLRRKGRLVPHKFHNLANYAGFLKSLNYDIGLAPLVDNHFNRGKSNIRWIEYSSNKAAVVASPIWAYKKDPYGIMKHGENVLYAREPEDWLKHLSKLIEDESYRKKLANQAHDDVLKHYNLETKAKEFVDYYQEIYDNYVPEIKPIVDNQT